MTFVIFLFNLWQAKTEGVWHSFYPPRQLNKIMSTDKSNHTPLYKIFLSLVPQL